jgi:hypothetical protein
MSNLESDSPARQLEALNALGLEQGPRPTGRNLERILQLMRCGESDVRRAATFVLAVHWTCDEALPPLLELLRDPDATPETLLTGILAIPKFSQNPDFKVDQILHVLAEIVLNSGFEGDIRGAAYVSMLEVAGRLHGVRELASMPDELERMDVDWTWVSRCAESPGTNQSNQAPRQTPLK